MPRASRVFPFVALATIALSLSCGDDPTAPVPAPLDVTVQSEQVVLDSAWGRRTATIRFRAASQERYRVVFNAYGDSLGLYAVGAAGDTSLLAWPLPAGRDTTARTMDFTAPAGGADQRLVVVARGRRGGRFRLVVQGQTLAPEARSAAVRLGEVVAERIDGPRDVDVYELANDRDRAVVFSSRLVDAPDGGAPPIAVTIAPASAPANPRIIRTLARASVLDSTASGRLALPAGTWRIVVGRPPLSTTVDDRVRYELLVQGVDTLPERAPAQLVLGDTAVEAIDHPGDVDEFEIVGGWAGPVVVLLQSTSATDSIRARYVHPDAAATLVARPGAPLAGALALVDVTAPERRTRIRVDADWLPPGPRGSYRIVAFQPDTTPASGTVTVRPGERVSGRLSGWLERDGFTLSLQRDAAVTFRLTRRPAAGAPDVALVLGAPSRVGVAPLPLVTTAGYDGLGLSAALARPAGTSAFTVFGIAAVSAYPAVLDAGPPVDYDVFVTRVDSLPEAVPAQVAIGDSVRGEALDYLGDVDRFHLASAYGDTILIGLRAGSARTPFPFAVRIVSPLGSAAVEFDVPSGYDSTFTRRVDVGSLRAPGGAPYRIEVFGASSGRDSSEVGSYLLHTARFTSTPERHAATLALGDTLADERLDYPGDIDEFEFTGPPGAEVVFTHRFVRTPPFFTGVARILVIDPATRAILSAVSSDGGTRFSTPVTMPPTGRVRLLLADAPPWFCAPTCDFLVDAVGSVFSTSYAIDRAPEGLATSFAVGDTITSELAPVGDIDEFHFTAAAGDTLRLTGDLPATPVSAPDQTTVAIIDESSGLVVASAWLRRWTGIGTLDTTFVAPSSGRYLLRVSPPDMSGPAGWYRFVVTRRP